MSKSTHVQALPRPTDVFAMFRMLLACVFGVNEKACMVELGISRKLMWSLQNGTTLPDAELAERIRLLSLRWSYGEITADDWPKPAVDRRGTTRLLRRRA